MTTELWYVRPTDLANDDLTDQLFGFMHQAELDTHGEWTVRAIHEGIMERKLVCFAAVENGRIVSVCCVSTLDFENKDRIGRFWWCVAERNTMPRWIHHFKDIAGWMRKQGCSRVDGRFRKGWVRVLRKYGLKDTHAVCEMELV